MDDVLYWALVVGVTALAVIAVALAVRVLLWILSLLGFDRRAYFAGLTVLAVALPGVAGFATSGLFLVNEVDLPEDDGVTAFALGSTIAIVIWLVSAFFFQRYGRVEDGNPTEYRRLRAYHDSLRTGYLALGADQQAEPAAQLADAELNGVAAALRIAGDDGLIRDDGLTRGVAWASQGGYIVVRARLDKADRALREFDPAAALPALADELRSQIDGSRIAGSAALLETLRTTSAMLAEANPNEVAARAQLRQVGRTLDRFRDGRRYGLVSARSALYGPIVLGGLFAYFALGLALVGGATRAQVGAGVAFYLVGIVVGVIRHLVNASTADSQVEEDYGLDDARLLQRPLFSGAAAVAGVVLVTMLAALAPQARTDGQSDGQGTPAAEARADEDSEEQRAQTEVPSLEEIFDLGRNPLGLLYAAIFGLAPALLTRRLGEAAETFKVDLRSTQASEQAGGT